jgi:uncharacterized repeat protein (TIGR01451 family)
LNFGNAKTGSLAGKVFHDVNENGKKDTDEEYLGYIALYVDKNNNKTADTGEETTTSSATTGDYEFNPSDPGEKRIRVSTYGWKLVNEIIYYVNSGQATTGRDIPLKQVPDLELDITADKTSVNVGDTVEFTLRITNKGLADTTGVAIKDVCPPGLTCTAGTPSQGSYDSGTSTWTVGDMAKDGEATLVVNATVNSVPSDPYTAQVTASDEEDQDSTPDNMSGTTVAEDDEAAVTLTENESPTLTTGDTAVNKGGSVTITDSKLKAEDTEDTNSTLKYTLTTAPTKGDLYLTPEGEDKTKLTTTDGSNTFTQDDVDNGRITYEHGGTDTLDDLFKVKVTDSGNAESAEGTVNINIAPTVTLSTTVSNPTNTSPIPVTAKFSEKVTGLTEGEITVENGTVKSGTLQTTDEGKTWTFSVVPDDDGEVKVTIPADTAQDAADNNNTASNTLSVTYDGTVPSVTVTPKTTNDTMPELTGTVDDPDATVKVKVDEQEYTADVSPTANEDGTYNWTVSVPEGSELPIGTYEVVATATDKAGNVGTDTSTNELVIESGNTPPIITTATPLTITQGSTLPLSNTNLKATDNEDKDPAKLIYTLVTTPTKGVLKQQGSDTPLKTGDTFTQDDIDNGRITYEHGDTDSVDDSFKVTVTDSGTMTSDDATVTIKVNPKPQSLDLSEEQIKLPGLTEEGTTIPDGQTYKLTEEPTVGTVYRVTEDGTEVPLEEGDTFTQQEIDEGNIVYKQPEGQPIQEDNFTFTGEGGVIEGKEINFVISNDPPVVATNEPLRVNQGSTTPISNTNLKVTDTEDKNPAKLTYTLVTTPTYGLLLKDDEPLQPGDTFTQDDIDQGKISYQNTDPANPATDDSFTFTVTDSGKAVVGTPDEPLTFDLPVNSKPVIQPISEGEGETPQAQPGLNPLKDLISGGDTEDDANEKPLTYTVVEKPTSGTLWIEKDGERCKLEPGDTFTQADLDEGKVTYEPGDATEDDTFTFKTTDSEGAESGDIPITIGNIAAPKPGESAFALKGTEGQPVPLTEDAFKVPAGYTGTPEDLIYKLTEAPTNGSLLKDGKPLGVGEDFTQADIDEGKISYKPNNADVEEDAFAFTMREGAEGPESDETPVKITFNKKPTVASKPLAGNQGGTIPLTESALKATDKENSDPTKLVYTLAEAPTKGVLKKNGVPLKEGDTFTQADIDEGKVGYEHTDKSVPALDENFKLKVKDADGAESDVPVTIKFNNKPTVATKPLEAGITGSVPLTEDNLKASDREDSDPTKLVYTLAEAPTKGVLKNMGDPLKPGDTFTQDDLDKGRIAYEYTGEGLPITEDAFAFTVKDSGGAESDKIPFTVGFDLPLALEKEDVSVPAKQEKGVAIPITEDNLKANEAGNEDPSKLVYTMVTTPTKGTFQKDGQPLKPGDTFTQDDIDTGKVSYQPDDEEAQEDDMFMLKVTDSKGEESEPFPFAVNYAKKPLVESTPLKADLGATMPITEASLKATDLAESAPADLVYTLVTTPTKGKLLKNGEPLDAGDTFTQADIDEGNLAYEHTDDSIPALDDMFTFTVTDPQGVESDEIPFVITFNPVLGLEMDLVCDTIAIAGSLMHCTVVYTNTGTITTTALSVGVTQPMNTIYDPDTSDPRWKVAIGDKAMSSIDRLSGDMITYDYVALVDSLGPKQSGAIKVAFRVSEDLTLGEPVGLNAGFQDRQGEEVVQEAQDSASVSIAKSAIYMPLVAKVTTQ